jgi:phenylacetate-CoA ligase
MATLPLTRKHDLIAHERELLATDVQPYMTSRTTGTTGHPAEIWISRYEIELWAAIAALGGVLRAEIGPDDCLQINISSRATAAIQMNMSVARQAHARARALGIIPPAESLESLLGAGGEFPTQMNTYPSYLAQIVNLARSRNLGPNNFRLKRVICGGEVLSPALAHAAKETLGLREVSDAFGMTEVLPVSGRVCSQGHVHFDLNMGYVEVMDLDTGMPATPGALGSVVITPYYPYRECMPLFRYDTRDVVRVLPDAPLTCEFAGIAATSRILGKADHLLRLPDRIVTMRDLVEVYEALP